MFVQARFAFVEISSKNYKDGAAATCSGDVLQNNSTEENLKVVVDKDLQTQAQASEEANGGDGIIHLPLLHMSTCVHKIF